MQITRTHPRRQTAKSDWFTVTVCTDPNTLTSHLAMQEVDETGSSVLPTTWGGPLGGL